MGIDQLSIKLEDAKRIVAIPKFKQDELLKVALVALSTLQLPLVSEAERKQIECKHRRLAFLGDRLLDAVLADYLFATYPKLTNKDLDDWRQELTSRESLSEFAIELDLPSICSSWNRKDRKPPEEEPSVYGEMFEALVAVVYIDSDRSFEKLSKWLRDRVLDKAIAEFDRCRRLLLLDGAKMPTIRI